MFTTAGTGALREVSGVLLDESRCDVEITWSRESYSRMTMVSAGPATVSMVRRTITIGAS